MDMSRKTMLKGLQEIPGVGPRIAANLLKMGIRRPADLKGKDPRELYDRLARLEGARQDPCVLYVFRCAVYYASRKRHDPEKLKWWNWKIEGNPPQRAS
jgi:hypothetical protein